MVSVELAPDPLSLVTDDDPAGRLQAEPPAGRAVALVGLPQPGQLVAYRISAGGRWRFSSVVIQVLRT
jgi:hypothetical protein